MLFFILFLFEEVAEEETKEEDVMSTTSSSERRIGRQRVMVAYDKGIMIINNVVLLKTPPSLFGSETTL